MKYILTLVLVQFFLFHAVAQEQEIPAKAVKQLNAAKECIGKQEYEDAITKLQKAVEVAPEFADAFMLLGDVYSYLEKFDNAIVSYLEVIRLDSNFNALVHFKTGVAAFRLGDYASAKAQFDEFLGSSGIMFDKKVKAQEYLGHCKFALKAKKNPVPFNPVNLGDSINSGLAEFHPALTADEHLLVYTVRLKKGKQVDEDFYITYKKDGKWAKAESMGPPTNTRMAEGALCISPDGRFIFFTACNRREGMGGCDIYVSERLGRSFGPPINLGEPINTPGWESQPSISADGKRLYFASNRKGGIGKKDIWVSLLDAGGHWGEPRNLGETINTRKDEKSPFIHPDGQTLYFASDGRVGMGGSDLYISRMSEGKWSKAVNLGFPINTQNDEISLVVSTDGQRAYFASDRVDGKGDLDLYSFVLHRNIRPQPVTYLKGNVYDKFSKEKIGALVELIDLETNMSVVVTRSDEQTGEFLVCLLSGKNYALNVEKVDYLFYSENFELTHKKDNIPYELYIPLKPMGVGATAILKNIFFELDSYELKTESKTELEILIDFMKYYSDVSIEIGGHTDSTGTQAHNLKLSEDRARSVYDYLIEKGIVKSRLGYKGFGDTSPIATNQTEKGRAENRRTEFKITGM
ncbi:MAG: PD40 domain-containing protein [Bacteroidetes bacterium]|nr:PD40 domain-containing protein [Bacteroidota bacterium]